MQARHIGRWCRQTRKFCKYGNTCYARVHAWVVFNNTPDSISE